MFWFVLQFSYGHYCQWISVTFLYCFTKNNGAPKRDLLGQLVILLSSPGTYSLFASSLVGDRDTILWWRRVNLLSIPISWSASQYGEGSLSPCHHKRNGTLVLAVLNIHRVCWLYALAEQFWRSSHFERIWPDVRQNNYNFLFFKWKTSKHFDVKTAHVYVLVRFASQQ